MKMKRKLCGRPAILLLLLFLIPIEALAQGKNGTFPYDAPVVDKEDRSTNHPLVVVACAASMPDCRKGIEQLVALSDSFRNTDVKYMSVDVSPLETKKISRSDPDKHRQFTVFERYSWSDQPCFQRGYCSHHDHPETIITDSFVGA